MRWYASLVMICVVGVALIVFSKYQLTHPSASTQPTVGTHWYAGLAFDVCGTVQPDLAANPSTGSLPGLTTQGDGIIYIAPKSSKDAGANATLGRFVETYPGLVLDSDTLKLPKKSPHHNGDVCPHGTPDSGKQADVVAQMWPSVSGAGADQPVTEDNPPTLKLGNDQLITVAFVPPGAHIPKPNPQTIVKLVNLVSGQSTSSTTTPLTVPVSVPSSTSAPSATTPSTAPATTAPTTTKPSTTATTAKP